MAEKLPSLDKLLDNAFPASVVNSDPVVIKVLSTRVWHDDRFGTVVKKNEENYTLLWDNGKIDTAVSSDIAQNYARAWISKKDDDEWAESSFAVIKEYTEQSTKGENPLRLWLFSDLSDLPAISNAREFKEKPVAFRNGDTWKICRVTKVTKAQKNAIKTNPKSHKYMGDGVPSVGAKSLTWEEFIAARREYNMVFAKCWTRHRKLNPVANGGENKEQVADKEQVAAAVTDKEQAFATVAAVAAAPATTSTVVTAKEHVSAEQVSAAQAAAAKVAAEQVAAAQAAAKQVAAAQAAAAQLVAAHAAVAAVDDNSGKRDIDDNHHNASAKKFKQHSQQDGVVSPGSVEKKNLLLLLLQLVRRRALPQP
jgi:hypothetical protein